MTRTIYVAIGIGLLSLASAYASEIREFDIPTLEKLGRELSRRDEMAARASDLVLAKHPELKTGPLLEWITDLSNGGSVYWIVDTETQPTPVYKVTGDRIEDIHGKPLPLAIATRYKARQTAIRAARPKLNTAYGARYNFEVLNDPDGSGFLVYALAAFTKKYPVYTGGHLRITVSADGSKVERIDELSHGIIGQKADRGTEILAVATAQVVKTKYPVETWIYTSHLYNMPMYVATTDGAAWGVANGRIVRVDAKGPKNHLEILNGKAPEVPQD